MKYRDSQKGTPETVFTGTKAAVEALTAAEGMVAYATDTHLFGDPAARLLDRLG